MIKIIDYVTEVKVISDGMEIDNNGDLANELNQWLQNGYKITGNKYTRRFNEYEVEVDESQLCRVVYTDHDPYVHYSKVMPFADAWRIKGYLGSNLSVEIDGKDIEIDIKEKSLRIFDLRGQSECAIEEVKENDSVTIDILAAVDDDLSYL